MIRLSEKHGVNPALGVCFWCGEEDGTILLPGRLPNDAEAPRHMMHGYEPCDTCKEQMKLGCTLIEVQIEPLFNRQPPLGIHYPTRNWWVIKREAAKRMNIEEDKVLIDTETAERLGLREVKDASGETQATSC